MALFSTVERRLTRYWSRNSMSLPKRRVDGDERFAKYSLVDSICGDVLERVRTDGAARFEESVKGLRRIG